MRAFPVLAMPSLMQSMACMVGLSAVVMPPARWMPPGSSRPFGRST